MFAARLTSFFPYQYFILDCPQLLFVRFRIPLRINFERLFLVLGSSHLLLKVLVLHVEIVADGTQNFDR